MANKVTAFNVKFTDLGLHKKLKVLSVITGEQMNDIILKSVRIYLSSKDVREIYQQQLEKEN